jgi:hypothetical protein
VEEVDDRGFSVACISSLPVNAFKHATNQYVEENSLPGGVLSAVECISRGSAYFQIA